MADGKQYCRSAALENLIKARDALVDAEVTRLMIQPTVIRLTDEEMDRVLQSECLQIKPVTSKMMAIETDEKELAEFLAQIENMANSKRFLEMLQEDMLRRMAYGLDTVMEIRPMDYELEKPLPERFFFVRLLQMDDTPCIYLPKDAERK